MKPGNPWWLTYSSTLNPWWDLVGDLYGFHSTEELSKEELHWKPWALCPITQLLLRDCEGIRLTQWGGHMDTEAGTATSYENVVETHGTGSPWALKQEPLWFQTWAPRTVWQWITLRLRYTFEAIGYNRKGIQGYLTVRVKNQAQGMMKRLNSQKVMPWTGSHEQPEFRDEFYP